MALISRPALAEVESDDHYRDELLALVKQQTDIATKTKMNADYVPGIVTVLYGADLEARGLRTVWEALSLVPGVQPDIEPTGRRKLTIRGIANVPSSESVKVLLNGIAQNATDRGLADPVFSIPVEQVDRIEMIRGPGSVIHGEFAYVGVINVITHQEENRAYAFAGGFDTQGAGANLKWQNDSGDRKLGLSLSGWRTDGADPRVEQDYAHVLETYFPEGGIGRDDSYAPGRANTDLEAATVAFDLQADDFSLTALWTESAIGDHFGINELLPPDPDRLVERTRTRSLEARQQLGLGRDTEGTLILGWQDNIRSRRDVYVGPPVIFGTAAPVFLDSDLRQTRQWLEWDLLWRGQSGHEVLAMASLASAQVLEDKSTFKNLDYTLPTLAGVERLVQSIAVQDQFHYSEMFSLTAGLRYDDYDDVGTHLTPRVSGVWRLEGGHIIKAQYAEAFRPLTLFDIQGDPQSELEPSTVHTYELGYILAGAQGETRVTAFHSSFSDAVMEMVPDFINLDLTAQGLELEHSRRIGYWKFDGDLSYVETEQEDTDATVERTPKWLANAAVIYELSQETTVALQGHHVSGFARYPAYPQPSADGYTTADLTVSVSGERHLGWRFGIKNLFDADVRYPAFYFMPVDYPQAGRTWWTQVTWNF